MQAFTTLNSLVVPLDRANVDTDAIIPKQFLKSLRRTGFGPYLFDEWRYLDHGEPEMDCGNRPLNSDFSLNQARYRGAQILLARENFGCGSSREHAVWALDGYGIRALIAPSFADIFQRNCLRNGLLPIVLGSDAIESLFSATQSTPGYELLIDLPAQTVTSSDGDLYAFEIDVFSKECLLRNLDDIELTLQHAGDIRSYEVDRRQKEPWMFGP
jgi:3-isopropylmalate/(R)-2-methylmalate dehydratase small subunit